MSQSLKNVVYAFCIFLLLLFTPERARERASERETRRKKAILKKSHAIIDDSTVLVRN